MTSAPAPPPPLYLSKSSESGTRPHSWPLSPLGTFHGKTSEAEILTSSVHTSLDYDVLTDAQWNDPETPACRTSITNLQWWDIPYNKESNTISCDISTSPPPPLSQQVFRKWYSTSFMASLTPRDVPRQNS